MNWLAVVGTREMNDAICRDIERFISQKIAEGSGECISIFSRDMSLDQYNKFD